MKKVRVSGDRNHPLIRALLDARGEEALTIRRYIEIIPNDGYSLVICESAQNIKEDD